MALALALTQSVAATSVSVDAERGVDDIGVRASAVLHADVGTAWRVLTDYERYVDFVPGLRRSQVVSRHGDVVTVQQSGQAALGLIKVPMQVTFEVTERPPDRLQSRAVAGSLRALRSCYALTAVPSGVRLDYLGHVAPGFGLLGPIEQAVVERNMARQFQALADEIERQGARTLSQAVEGPP